MRFFQFVQILHNMGWKYVIFRASHEVKRKLKILKSKYPTHYLEQEFISLSYWRDNSRPFFFDQSDCISISKNSDLVAEEARRILNGEFCFFSSIWYNIGTDYDWITNPVTGYSYDVHKHWTEVEDFLENAGDIKYVWEKSRFSFVYSLIRYDHKTKNDHSLYIFSQILDWIDKNPINSGPNYKCSQEISLRVLNWIFALYYYKKSASLTDSVFKKILNSIYWQVKHVYSNINFSRIAVRNNHAITETLALYATGLLFPSFPESNIWRKKGKCWFEKEIIYQIAEDGTYLQFSMNYHRVVVQLLTWAIALSDRNNDSFSEKIYDRAYKSVNFLLQCQELSNGYLPNYGSNDGSLFFKLNDNDYRDYRPQLDVLHRLLTGSSLYKELFDDQAWLLTDWVTNRTMKKPLHQEKGCISFPIGGYYLIREPKTLTFIRCGGYKSRPAHADNLHVDIWYNGVDLLIDAGSYSYNTDWLTAKYFMGTESHNSLMLGSHDQMLKGRRFIWYYWTSLLNASLEKRENDYHFWGEIKTFKHLGSNIRHSRKIIKTVDKLEWIIEDEVRNKPLALDIRQIWHTKSTNLTFESTAFDPKIIQGYYSDSYGVKQPNKQIEFVSGSSVIRTVIRII